MKSASQNQIKLLRKLKQRKYRDQEGLFVLEGERAVRQVLARPHPEVEAVFCDEHKQEQYDTMAEFRVDSGVFEEVSNTEHNQGVLALCRTPLPASTHDLKADSNLIVAFDRIQDPGNLGTMVRTSAWFGVDALLVGNGTVELFHPKVARSTAGATGALPYLSGDLHTLLAELEGRQWNVVLLDGNEGAIPMSQFNTNTQPTILVVGNEGNGIHPDLITPSRTRLRIPKPGADDAVESLNAAIALGVVLGYYRL
ncbi:MAG: RNA methyltransferase [Bacteroidota bacterium]